MKVDNQTLPLRLDFNVKQCCPQSIKHAGTLRVQQKSCMVFLKLPTPTFFFFFSNHVIPKFLFLYSESKHRKRWVKNKQLWRKSFFPHEKCCYGRYYHEGVLCCMKPCSNSNRNIQHSNLSFVMSEQQGLGSEYSFLSSFFFFDLEKGPSDIDWRMYT